MGCVPILASELNDRIMQSGGPQYKSKKINVWQKAVSQVMPFVFGNSMAQVAVMHFFNESADAKIATILSAGTAARFLWALCSATKERYRENCYVAALSHMIALSRDAHLPYIKKRVKEVWRKDILAE